MSDCLRILLVEDNADDADLVLRGLGRAGLELVSERVEDPGALRTALEGDEWDIILADYSMPGFNGLDALRIAAERDVDLPVVLVSGAIDIPTALGAMKAGAKDFVLKDDTSRLPSIIEREVADADERRRRRLAEEERDRALAELQEANQQLGALADMTGVALSGLSSERLVMDLLGRVVATVGADGGAMLLKDKFGITSRGAVGPAASIAGENLSADFAARVAAEDQPRFIVRGNRFDEPDVAFAAELRALGIQCAVAVPMHDAGQVIGVLRVDWCADLELPEWELAMLELAADRSALTIENAAAYQREHSIAETLQQALLSVSTEIDGVEVGHFYASATEKTLVGGDFYDIFALEPGKVAFSIGDVSGKGVDAAIVTALVKNAIRTLAVDSASPETVMEAANVVISRFTDPGIFVTGVFGVLDLATLAVSFTTAGHPPPIVIGPSGTRELEEHGPLLGALEEPKYKTSTETLAPGESLVLYTDGLLEARDPRGHFYGPERLLESLGQLPEVAPQHVAAELFRHAWEFSAGSLRDDIAVLVLRPAVESAG